MNINQENSYPVEALPGQPVIKINGAAYPVGLINKAGGAAGGVSEQDLFDWLTILDNN